MTIKPTNRIYRITDAYMLEFAKTLRLFFIEDQPAFIIKDTNFALPFEMNWLTVITDAEAEPTDEQRDDQLKQLTNTVLEKMDDCRNCFQDAKRYIKKAFPNNIPIWNEFGFNDYDTVGRKQPEMIQFMKRFHLTALKYGAQLAIPLVNFDAAKVADIDLRRAALDTANNEQEKFKKDIPVFTQTRIDKLNAVWNICADVCDVGKSIFKNNYAKYQHYLLPPSDESPEVFILKGKVVQPVVGPIGTPAQPVEEVDVTITELPELTAQTDSNGNYGFGSMPGGTYTLVFSKAGYTTHTVSGVVITTISNPVTLNVTLMPE